jgi:hypothetical protein
MNDCANHPGEIRFILHLSFYNCHLSLKICSFFNDK